MTSTELAAWLSTDVATERAEELPDEASGREDGHQVLALLQKRRMDLTNDDVRLMLRVVDTVEEQGDGPAGQGEGGDRGEDSPWRRRLMLLGHDPLKPA
ncbi:DUF3140 domain-containing protein [Streptomyces sp. 8N706]|uniref:DUF3140 domain-containing protein n=1 Tax=Streptomyces sp. 8N706 TaxID=3457416 RepID=UPI003FD49C50